MEADDIWDTERQPRVEILNVRHHEGREWGGLVQGVATAIGGQGSGDKRSQGSGLGCWRTSDKNLEVS